VIAQECEELINQSINQSINLLKAKRPNGHLRRSKLRLLID